jgi:hypothetical protein
MFCKWRAVVCFSFTCLATGFGILAPSARALDTPNVLMAVDAMVMNHQGLFRNATPHDGFNTFQFGPVQAAAGSLGRYESFVFVGLGTGEGGGISHNARMNTNTPNHWNGTDYQTVAPLDITSAYAPVIDRVAFGQVFDHTEYQIEVKFKPNLGAPFPPAQQNAANQFGVGLDQQLGYVWDAEANTYKRAAEQNIYNIGSAANPINTWYETAPKDADGFATWTAPVSTPDFTQRSFYHNFGDNQFRLDNVVTGGGRVQNPDSTWSDSLIGYGENFTSFGGGPTDPARPGSKLNVPNGVPLISFGKGGDLNQTLSVEIKSIALARITPGPIVARLDANSGITYRFGSGLTRGNAATPIDVPNDPFGLGYLPAATDQISRFDANGLTNLKINMRTPDNANETHRFVLRGAPTPNTFDGSTATLNVRAKLLEPLSNAGNAQSLTIVAKDLDGSDTTSPTPPFNPPADPVGADEYTYNLDLSQFNTSTFTTVSVPLSEFTLSPFVAGPPSTGPFGFGNPGDGMLTNFNLYEFGGLIPPGGGLLKLELEYMEIRLPEAGLAGDFDDDGDVDGSDFLVWQRGGSPTPVSAGDLADWRANYGTGGGSVGAIGAVPEPGTLGLLACGLGLLGLRRRSGSPRL